MGALTNGTATARYGTEDAFGAKQVPFVSIALPGSTHAVRLWDEGNGDFWIDVDGENVAAWWRQDGKRTSRASVVLALLEGRFRQENGVVSVEFDGQMTRMRSRM